jgi:hypothetical protein
MMPSMILRGAVLTVEAVAGETLVTRDTNGQVHRLHVGPAGGTHVTHATAAVGDPLVVQRDSAPTGDTLVLAPCGCSILLLAEPAP